MQQIRKKKLTKATNKPTGVRSLATGSCTAFLDCTLSKTRSHGVHVTPDISDGQDGGCGLEGLLSDVRSPVHWGDRFEADSGGDGFMLNKDIVDQIALLSMRPVDIPTQNL